MTPKDLVVLVPDKNADHAIRGLMQRYQSIGINRVQFDVFTHPERDSGCLLRSQDFLRPLSRFYEHALVLFDREGCGRESLSRSELEEEVENRLYTSGWGERAACVVIDPELDVWVWSDSAHVPTELGWTGLGQSLREWLAAQGFKILENGKPERPKEALEEVLRHLRRPRSSYIYGRLAEVVGLERCVDPAFAKLRDVLTGWFRSGAASGIGPCL